MPTPFTPRRSPLYVLPGPNPGLVIRGTIDINNRPMVPNAQEGGTSSVFSESSEVELDGRNFEMLYPRVIPVGGGNYRVVSSGRAYQYANRSGQHLGIFDTPAHAESYARRLHFQQAKLLPRRR